MVCKASKLTHMFADVLDRIQTPKGKLAYAIVGRVKALSSSPIVMSHPSAERSSWRITSKEMKTYKL
jgi:hypothetical protein